MINMHAYGSSRNFSSKMMRWIDQVLSPPNQRYCPGGTWSPAINLYEDEAYYYVVADLAGVSMNEVDVRIKDGALILGGQRPMPRPPKNRQVSLQLMEIDHGRFCRSIELPSDVIIDKTQAYYRSGYLWVRIPRRG